jgi:hypothetical protein
MDNIEILVKTGFGVVPLNIYSPDFSWRESIFPPIVSITVRQGHHAAEIGDYEQYNFIMEVTMTMVSMNGPVAENIEPRRFWVMGKRGEQVDLYIFNLNKGIIHTFQRDVANWGAELEGASTTGWKKGVTSDNP